MGDDPEEIMRHFNAMPDEDFVAAMRGMIDGYSEGESYFNHPLVNEVIFYSNENRNGSII